jgi:hypothetical protein
LAPGTPPSAFTERDIPSSPLYEKGSSPALHLLHFHTMSENINPEGSAIKKLEKKKMKNIEFYRLAQEQ